MEIDIDNDNGPGHEIVPTLQAVHKLMVEGLRACGLKGHFAMVCLLPEVSDRAGMDVIRMCANLDEGAIASFIAHVARAIDPPESPKVRTISMAQALRLLDMMKADRDGDSEPKPEEKH